LRLLEATGVDAVLLLPFSRDLSLMTPHQFAHEILKKRLHAREVHEGYNFHFGHKARATFEMLRAFGKESEMGFEVHDYPEMRLRGENVSSSHIRKLLSEGRVSRARHLLARPFSILSTAGRGRGYGSKYTVPPSTWRATKNLFPKMAFTSPRTRGGKANVLTQSRTSATVQRSAPILLPLKRTC
jgi:riboflavin kinase/FMN adenylyltransferase